MSLTIAYCTADFAIMSGDYRRTHIEDDSEFYDDTPKAFQMSDHVLCGITGDLRVMQDLRATVKTNQKAKFSSVVKSLEKALAVYKETDAQCTVILAGKDNKGRMRLAEISHHTDFKAEVQSVKPGEIKWHYAYSYVDPAEIIGKEYAKLEDVTADSISAMAQKVNESVAKIDGRVSAECDVIRLIG